MKNNFLKFHLILKMISRVRFNQHQVNKFADQLRLLSWAQGAIFFKELHYFSFNGTIIVIVFLFVLFQLIAAFIDKGEK